MSPYAWFDIKTNMAIIMYMNIYMNKENEAWLLAYKERGGSMSGLINNLMERHIHGELKQPYTPPPIHDRQVLTANDGSIATTKKIAGADAPEWEEIGKTELPSCCKMKQPCKHWIFDGLKDSWVNTLSGEVREVT